MFRPVGNQSPAVYWRRRLFFLAALIALIALIAVTAHVVLGKDSAGNDLGNGTGSHSPAPSSPAGHTSTHQSTPSSPQTSSSTVTHSSSGSTVAGSGSSSTMPNPCTPAQLAVAAVTSQPTYAVGAQPTLSLQVTNTGTEPCVQNLADSQVLLTVYNGLSRVWGSHDCEVQPGTDERTLGVNLPVKISVVWSGRSSEPHCAGVRQQVGAGSYTLIPALSGKTGKAAQFAIH